MVEEEEEEEHKEDEEEDAEEEDEPAALEKGMALTCSSSYLLVLSLGACTIWGMTARGATSTAPWPSHPRFSLVSLACSAMFSLPRLLLPFHPEDLHPPWGATTTTTTTTTISSILSFFCVFELWCARQSVPLLVACAAARFMWLSVFHLPPAPSPAPPSLLHLPLFVLEQLRLSHCVGT